MILTSIFSIAQAIIYLLCILLSEVSTQCTDPLIYKLNDIQQFMANITARQENCTAQIQKLTEKLETQEEKFKGQEDKLEKQVVKNR